MSFGISGGANKVLSSFGAGAALVFQDAFRAQEACDLLTAEHCSVIHGVDVHPGFATGKLVNGASGIAVGTGGG